MAQKRMEHMLADGPSLDSLSNFLEQAWTRYNNESVLGESVNDSADDGSSDADDEDRRAYISPELDDAWAKAERIFDDGHSVQGIVTGWNRGGLLVRWDRLQGFVPASQLKDTPIFESDEERDQELAKWVGEELSLKVIELDRNRNRLVFSERATMWGPKDGERIFAEIDPGDIRRGYVSNLCDFGAFVDLGGVDGLIHVSELSWGRVNHPRELLDLGQEVQVYVISVDQEQRRIALSLKRLHADPWTTVDKDYQVGQTVDAVVTNVVDFGAFARIDEGLEGLIHVSEFPQVEMTHPSEVVQSNEKVRVRILRIDSANHRLGLSMRLGPEEDLFDVEVDESPADPDEGEWDPDANLLY
jgi:small subunit ribosomal protein S1